MVSMKFTDDAAARIRGSLAKAGKGTRASIREGRIGSPCCGRMMLDLVITRPKNGDVQGEVQGIPFTVGSDLLQVYGSSFSISLDENGFPLVRAI